jgi:carbamoyl-phosphate synthase large subunit
MRTATPPRTKIKKVLILGSGGLKIGQAGEFDYSGSQAIKALKEEGIYTVLINPNIATVQTDGDMADRVYFQPLDVATVEKVILRERPDGILLGFGGQTALNLGLELDQTGFFMKNGVKVLGTPISAIKITEDRELFKRALDEIGVKSARSRAAATVEQALAAARQVGYPVMMRSGYSLGGLGSGRIEDRSVLRKRAAEILGVVPQVLIEEYLEGWKEIEYEVVRDIAGNIVTVCNMENMDPMGIHTGESIVVAPSQTLTNDEYHRLREIAIKTVSHLGIVGECNIQYALNPITGDYRVIEVNARLSRSSALASKATGYPLAFVASKLVLGYKLHEITNSVTGTTSAFYEPALDYLAVKLPRWDLNKFKLSDHHIGSEMKSVGEVMALGRSFPEALQKAVRMLNIGASGLTHHPFAIKEPLSEIKEATDRRLFAIVDALESGRTVGEINRLSGVDKWFLQHIAVVVGLKKKLKKTKLDKDLLRELKLFGFSDNSIAATTGLSENDVRRLRLKFNIRPIIKQIDTLAGEFAATTNYLYTTYHGLSNDVEPLSKKSIIILGSGPYCIGSSVEFDWCGVNSVKCLRSHKRPTITINSNPETVSTDFDTSDRLYFEELTLERVRDIADFEQSEGIVVSVGGQISNNLALPLHKFGYHLMGTSAEAIDRAENRQKFSSMLSSMGIDQPEWQEVTTLARAKSFAKSIGFPILIRPSYVLSGGAMNVVGSVEGLERYLAEATRLSPDHPVVMSRFITGAKELEIDGVAENGKIRIYAVSEHIENAGVHSGDATVVLPPQRLYLETVRRTKEITKKVVGELGISGPFNIQFLAKDNDIKVIECNVRASRSFPFVSKVTGYNFIEIATEILLGEYTPESYHTLELDHVGVKSPQFSYNRLRGVDPVSGVEMASTGEVACLGDNLYTAFYNSWMSTDKRIKGKNIFLSIADDDKHKIVDEVRDLHAAGWSIMATSGTHEYLKSYGIPSRKLFKISDKREPSVVTALNKHQVSLMINIPRFQNGPHEVSDAADIRRTGIRKDIPVVTNAEIAKILMHCLSGKPEVHHEPRSWQEIVKGEPGPEKSQ